MFLLLFQLAWRQSIAKCMIYEKIPTSSPPFYTSSISCSACTLTHCSTISDPRSIYTSSLTRYSYTLLLKKKKSLRKYRRDKMCMITHWSVFPFTIGLLLPIFIVSENHPKKVSFYKKVETLLGLSHCLKITQNVAF